MAFDYVDHNKLWEILKEMGKPDHLTCFLRNLYAGQEETVRTGHGTTDWFQIRKGVYCHPAYLTYMQSTSCEMLDWMKQKLESRLTGGYIPNIYSSDLCLGLQLACKQRSKWYAHFGHLFIKRHSSQVRTGSTAL